MSGYGLSTSYSSADSGSGWGKALSNVKLREDTFTPAVLASLPAFSKRFYYEHPAVTARGPEEVDAYRRQHQIHTEGEGVPKPVTTFDEASFPGKLSATTSAQVLPKPTDITPSCVTQSMCWRRHSRRASRRRRLYRPRAGQWPCLAGTS